MEILLTEAHGSTSRQHQERNKYQTAQPRSSHMMGRMVAISGDYDSHQVPTSNMENFDRPTNCKSKGLQVRKST